MTDYKFDGISWPKDPLKVVPTNTSIGRRGSGVQILAQVWSFEMDLGFLDVGDKNFYFSRYVAQGVYVTTLEHPKDDSLVSITGTTIEDFRVETMDVPDFAENCKITIGNIILP